MAIGNVGTYATITPPNRDYISESIRSIADSDFRDSEQRRAEQNAQEKARQEEQAKLNTQNKEDDTKLKPVTIGVENLDNAHLGFGRTLKEQTVKLRNERLNADNKRKAEIDLLLFNGFTGYEKLGNQLNMITQMKDDVVKNKDLYNVDDVADFGKAVQSLGKMNTSIDEKNMSFKITSYKLDENGKPLKDANGNFIKVFDNENIDTILANMTPFKAPKADDLIKNFKTTTKLKEVGGNDPNNPYVTYDRQELTQEQKDNAMLLAESISKTDDEMYAQLIKEGTVTRDRNVFEQNRERIKNKLYNEMISSFGGKNIRKTDQGAIDAKNQDLYNRERDAIADSKQNEVTPSIKGSFITQKGTITVRSGKEVNGKEIKYKIQDGARKIGFENVILKEGGGVIRNVAGAIINPTGKMYLKEEVTGGKTKTYNSSTIGAKKSGEASQNEAERTTEDIKETYYLDFSGNSDDLLRIDKYAKKAGYRDAYDLQQSLLKQADPNGTWFKKGTNEPKSKIKKVKQPTAEELILKYKRK